MTTINLRDFYPWYISDEFVEVTDEVAAELRADKLYEAAHTERVRRNKAYYSLDCDDGIQYSACVHEPSPQTLIERMESRNGIRTIEAAAELGLGSRSYELVSLDE